ncbi:hypothetical protein KFU94_69345 [Chloroflexi bacterium TSY]|nr:hypothetical protein [Chloroflexi bacterium TSY]
MANRPTTPPYREAQATAWLAWLAYNMRAHDLTIFQIENLQPDWLAGHKEKAPNLFVTRMLWGGWCGLSAGLMTGLIFLLLSDLIGDLIGDLSSGLLFGLMTGLSGALLGGMVRTFRITLREGSAHVQTIDSLQWSWQNVRRNARRGLILGLLFGLIYGLVGGLIVWLSDGLIGGLIYGLMAMLFFGLFFGLVGGIIGGFRSATKELKTRPNQGVWLTIRSSIKIGLPTGIAAGASLGLLLWDIPVGFGYGVAIFFIAGLWYGGLDVIEHGIIRLIIALSGDAPLNYARFLDYAAEELNFLQKVGGGYVFIHRYLLEHFAEIAVERGYVTVTSEYQFGSAGAFEAENTALSAEMHSKP